MSTAGVNLQQAAGTGTAAGPQSGQANKAQPAQGQMPQQAGSPPQQAPMNWQGYMSQEDIDHRASTHKPGSIFNHLPTSMPDKSTWHNPDGPAAMWQGKDAAVNQLAVNMHGQENVQAYYDALQKQQGGLGQGVGPQAEVNNQQGSQQKLEEVMRQVMNTALGK